MSYVLAALSALWRGTCWLAGLLWQAGVLAANSYSYWRQEGVLAAALSASAAKSSSCTVFFSPRGGCTDAIVAALGQARSTVIVQAYSFSSKPVAAALAAACRRGVRVRAVLDSEQRTARGCQAQACKDAGIEVVFDDAHLIAHNKVIVIDGQVVITGSFNFSASAETGNAENVVVINDAHIAQAYTANWEKHRSHSSP
jgi:phosphatidylserine/phosphatidylglycerophosphate/cardiolipin synthase-like enzyme